MTSDETAGPRFLLSAARDSGGRSQLFRPKNLNEFVFDGVGLVMYDLFWVKYGVALTNDGYDPRDQDELLLWLKTDSGDIDPTESILYYSLLSHYDDTAESTHPGSTILRNWLLQGQDRSEYDSYGGPYERCIEECERLLADPESYAFAGITDGVLAPWIRTRCHDRGIAIEDRMANRLSATATAEHPSEPAAMEALITTFVSTLGEILEAHPEFYLHKDTNPIVQTLQVAALLSTTGHADLERFGNRTVQFRETDAETLFTILTSFERGRRFIHSFIFMAYLDVTDQSGAVSQLRHIYSIYQSRPEEVVARAQERLGRTFDARVTQDIAATSFTYALNFFLTDGETIARDLFAETASGEQITVADVDRYFERERASQPAIGHFEEFLEYPEACEQYLPELQQAYADDGQPEIAAFLSHLQTAIARAENAPALLLEMLVDRETVSRTSTDEIYQLEQPPKTTATASFYGVNRMLEWTATLLRSVADA